MQCPLKETSLGMTPLLSYERSREPDMATCEGYNESRAMMSSQRISQRFFIVCDNCHWCCTCLSTLALIDNCPQCFENTSKIELTFMK
jgi:hypothetical protein